MQRIKFDLTNRKIVLLLFVSILIFSSCNNIKSKFRDKENTELKKDIDWSGKYIHTRRINNGEGALLELVIKKDKINTYDVSYYSQMYVGATIHKYLCKAIIDNDTLKIVYISNDNGTIEEYYKNLTYLFGLYYKNDTLHTKWIDGYGPEEKKYTFVLDDVESGTIQNLTITENNSNSKRTEHFPTVTINSQNWMSKNLDVDRYRNGDEIPHVQNMEEWSTLNYGAWCYYNNNPANGEKYGKIYNNYAVNDKRGLAPEGFHIATTKEWVELTNSLGNLIMAADKLKSKDSWQVNGSDIYGMNIKGGGYISRGGYSSLEGYTIGIWTSTYKDVWISYNNRENWNDNISFSCDSPPIKLNNGNGTQGFYVRCIKDN